MNNRVLIVDDNQNLLDSMRRQLGRDFKITTCQSAQEGLETVERDGPFAVVVSDMKMPNMDGVEFLKRLAEENPHTVRIMLTGNADQTTAVNAVNEGKVFSFLNKPCDGEQLKQVVRTGMQQYDLVERERELLEGTLNGIACIVTDLIGIMDPNLHVLGETFKQEMRSVLTQLNVLETWDAELAAMLCMVGFLTLPSDLRQKHANSETLSEKEQELFLKHPEIAAQFLSRVPRLQSVSRYVRYQLKNYDGSGSPDEEIKGDEIPLPSRILRILNDLYLGRNEKTSRAEVLREMKTKSGVFYDPEILEAVSAATTLNDRSSEGDFDPAAVIEEAQSSKEESEEVAEEKKTTEQKYSPPRKVTAKELAKGQILLSEVRAKNGVLLVREGNVLSEIALQSIMNYAEIAGLREPIIVVEPVGEGEEK